MTDEEKQEMIALFLDEVDPIELIQVACFKLDWALSVENTNGDDTEIKGMVLGEEEWIEDHTLDMENFDIWHLQNGEEDD